jgi:hypothetical protein
MIGCQLAIWTLVIGCQQAIEIRRVRVDRVAFVVVVPSDEVVVCLVGRLAANIQYCIALPL